MNWLAVGAALVFSAHSGAPDRFEKKVEVDGATYRVTVKRGVVTVAKKSLIVAFSIDERDRMRRAAKLATGCSVVDEFPNGAKLKGKLLCDGS